MRKLLAVIPVTFVGLIVFISVTLATANPLTHVSSTEIPPATAGGATSECPASRPAFAGGFYAPGDPLQAAELTVFRAHGLGWRVRAVNSGAEPVAINVESYCGNGRNAPGPQERSATLRLAPLTSVRVVARCRVGETLVAAGFRNSIDPISGRHVVVTGLQRIGARSARVTAANLSLTDSGLATAYAYCGDGRRPVRVESTEAVAPGKVGYVVARCPGGGRDPDFKILFGGFRASAPDLADGTFTYPAQMRSNGSGKVIVRAVNRGSERIARMTAIAYCR
jgi:hypothetical protein